MFVNATVAPGCAARMRRSASAPFSGCGLKNDLGTGAGQGERGFVAKTAGCAGDDGKATHLGRDITNGP